MLWKGSTMTMRNRTRTLTPRKRRLWTQQSGDMVLAAADTGTGSQQIIDLSAEFQTQSGQLLAQGVTLSRIFVKGLVSELVVASTPTLFSVGLAVQLGASGLDLGDHPSIFNHEGRPQLSWVTRLMEPSATSAEGSGFICMPTERAMIDVESRSQRTAWGHGLRFVAIAEKDGATEAVIRVSVAVTCLWLY